MKTNFLKNINEIPKQFLFNPKIINIDNLKIKKPKYFIILGMGGFSRGFIKKLFIKFKINYS